jgi:DNA-binding response OmpR family regulator
MTRTVLLVQDHPPAREKIRRILLAKHFQVDTVADYRAAVNYLANSVPHLVCLDLALVMSDRSSPEDMAHAEEVGANAFLKKPFTRERLLKYVDTLLDGQHASRPSVRRLRRTGVPPPV